MFKQIIRHYSVLSNQKPLLLDILPSRKVLSKLLFDHDAKHNINAYIPIITSIYDHLDNLQIPKNFKGNDLLTFQKVLKEIRKKTHTTNPHLVKLETQLIELAAERGSRDALTIVSFQALADKHDEFSPDDKKSAKKFIKQLMELEHPLAFKMAADYALRSQANFNPDIESLDSLTTDSKNIARAIELYNHFLEIDPKSYESASAHRALGTLFFKQLQLTKAREHLLQAVSLAPISENSQAHFLLGVLYEKDPLRARYHFQSAAQEGFLESFVNLGYLELNWFDDPKKAIEWFKLGAELGDNGCVIGLFDSNVRLKNWENANKVLARVEKLPNGNLQDLEKMRSSKVKMVRTIVEKEKKTKSIKSDSLAPEERKSRWDI